MNYFESLKHEKPSLSRLGEIAIDMKEKVSSESISKIANLTLERKKIYDMKGKTKIIKFLNENFCKLRDIYVESGVKNEDIDYLLSTIKFYNYKDFI